MSRICAVFILCLFPLAVGAEAILGTWISPPDARGQTGHVVMRDCGAGICGTLERAFDPKGSIVKTSNVGRQLLWNVQPTGAGRYEGRAFVPVFGRDFPARLKLEGNRLSVTGCAAAICKRQIWQRKN